MFFLFCLLFGIIFFFGGDVSSKWANIDKKAQVGEIGSEEFIYTRSPPTKISSQTEKDSFGSIFLRAMFVFRGV